MDINNAGGTVGTKKKNRKNNSRKHRRNYRWDGVFHSLTKYRGSDRRTINKARRAAQRSRKLQRLKDTRNGISFKDHRTEGEADFPQGSGTPQR